MMAAVPRADTELSKKDLIIQQLRAEIVSGQIPPGMKLSEARLARAAARDLLK